MNDTTGPTVPLMDGKLRPVWHLEGASKMYPNAWKMIDPYRAARGTELPDWPDWCFLPMAAWYNIVADDAGSAAVPPARIPDVARLAALGAWRYSQGIYRLDPDLYQAVIHTPPTDSIPNEALLHFPEWCLYVETPGLSWFDRPLYGFFAHLEYDTKQHHTELRLLFDGEELLAPFPLHLNGGSLLESVNQSLDVALRQAKAVGFSHSGYAKQKNVMAAEITNEIRPIISLLLYVLSNAVDWPDRQRPSNPEPKKTRRRGFRLFPADHPRVWNLGTTVGEKIRDYRDRSHKDGYRLKPHIRRAHWHGFWKGPRDGEREYFLKWLPPIPVGVAED